MLGLFAFYNPKVMGARVERNARNEGIGLLFDDRAAADFRTARFVLSVAGPLTLVACAIGGAALVAGIAVRGRDGD